jgi:adenylate cyclase
MRRWFTRFVMAGVAPGDDEQQQLRAATLTLVMAVVTVLSPVWVFTYLLLGRPLSAAIPAGFIVVAIGLLAYLFKTKRLGLVAPVEIGLFILLPVALQWTLGGFERGSAVALWAFVAPLTALVAWGWRAASWLLVVFLAAMVISGLAEPILRPLVPPLPEVVSTAFFVLNVTAPSTSAFLLLVYFIRQRDAAADRSEELLLNVLPVTIARRLKSGSGEIADGYESASVVFVDIVAFTSFADRTPPERVVFLLGRVFAVLDQLVEARGLEKIKTLGDGYLAVAGVPTRRADHALAAARMAIATPAALQQAMAGEWPDLRVRIGIASGPLVAGIIGRRRFSFDLWGDTVNTASRMASIAEPGTIRVTDATRVLLGETVTVGPAAQVEVKGKGVLTTYQLLAAT